MDAAPDKPQIPRDTAEALESLERLIRRYNTLTPEEGVAAARAILAESDVEATLDVIYAHAKPLEEKPARPPRGRGARGGRGPRQPRGPREGTPAEGDGEKGIAAGAPETSSEATPTEKPAEEQAAEAKPTEEQAAEEKPAETPSEAPAEPPAEAPSEPASEEPKEG